MNNLTDTSASVSIPTFASRKLIFLLGLAIGVIVANIYYAQPLIAPISKSLGLDPAAAGLTVMITQVGYGLGVLFIVPLADLVENRRLILTMISIAIVAILGIALSTSLVTYFASALAVGLGASTVQIIVPYAAHLTPEAMRGRVVGSLMSGLMLGIMFSRPIASLLTDLLSWHAVFYLSAAFMTGIAITLYRALPRRRPNSKDLRYGELIVSMGHLFTRMAVLRRRAIYQACMFGAFCLFWTASPLLLGGPEFNMSQTEIAIFALVGVSGAIVAPLAGLAADRGMTRLGTFISMGVAAVSFLMTHIFPLGSTASLACLVASAILLDAGITANLVLGQRSIFRLPARYRSRLNGLYVATIFVGGAFGSTMGAYAFTHGGWPATSWVGFALPVAALLYFGTEWLTGYQDLARNRR